jgi:predicted DNA binding CopG/RHH family protein
MKTKNNFDSEELEIIAAFNNNKLIRSTTEKEDIENAKLAALNTVNKFEEVLIELPVKDLQRLKKKALQTGISYQNLISALIHKYVDKINVRILME